MNRRPLVNIPRQKKAPKPLRRPTEPLKRSTHPLRREGKVGRQKRKEKADSKAIYFLAHGWTIGADQLARCQICGDPLLKAEADACHKIRASQTRRRATGLSGEDPRNILAGHRRCHTWMDSHKAHERVAVASPANCLTGGVVAWPAAMLNCLRTFGRPTASPLYAGEDPGPCPCRPGCTGSGSGPGTTSETPDGHHAP